MIGRAANDKISQWAVKPQRPNPANVREKNQTDPRNFWESELFRLCAMKRQACQTVWEGNEMALSVPAFIRTPFKPGQYNLILPVWAAQSRRWKKSSTPNHALFTAQHPSHSWCFHLRQAPLFQPTPPGFRLGIQIQTFHTKFTGMIEYSDDSRHILRPDEKGAEIRTVTFVR